MKSTITFADTSIAFSYKTDKELQKSHFLFSSINNPLLSKLGANIVKIALKIKLPVTGIIRNTIFKHFCGGETIEECSATIEKLANFNIKTILDYAAEGDSGKNSYDASVQEILRTIDRAANDPNIPFSVFKPTGIASIELMEKMQLGKKLTAEEEEEVSLIRKRFDIIASACYEKNVRLYTDSEDSFYQDPIDQFAFELMSKYNKKKVIVYNTFQMYRKNMLDKLMKAHQEGRKKGYFVGAKLVRGAYMEKERERAEEWASCLLAPARCYSFIRRRSV